MTAARPMGELTNMMAGAFAEQAPAPPGGGRPTPGAAPAPETLYSDALILSGGGQWGAYGAGVIKGWSARGRLPARITTGISTGALQATFAYLGPRFDDGLIEAYSIRDEGELVDRHNGLFILANGSMADTAPLKAFIQRRIEPLVDEVAAEHDRSGRALVVGAVDALSGDFKAFDLGAIASQLTGTERRDCYTAALLASSAVPVVFRQVTINGRPWLDGGVRHSFLLPETVREIIEARAMAAGANRMINTDGRIYALRNGTVAPEMIKQLPAELLPTLWRLRTIIFNQVDQDSLDLAAVYADRAGLSLYTTTADGWDRAPRIPACRGQDPAVKGMIFDPRFMACLTAFGSSQWSNGHDPWQKYKAP
ncbi:patatin-like phospholipase family protein [Sphingomonas sp.]|uniref:patatin-like phospholipase family protein n=1 Tax=Sphingomonas sp. TaxID=28214 RepID=UPI00286C9D88|nr:patatin-like phospholipase family protein [Sphingomonas sp.]